jgi:hypothetical protein
MRNSMINFKFNRKRMFLSTYLTFAIPLIFKILILIQRFIFLTFQPWVEKRNRKSSKNNEGQRKSANQMIIFLTMKLIVLSINSSILQGELNNDGFFFFLNILEKLGQIGFLFFLFGWYLFFSDFFSWYFFQFYFQSSFIICLHLFSVGLSYSQTNVLIFYWYLLL